MVLFACVYTSLYSLIILCDFMVLNNVVCHSPWQILMNRF